MNATMIVLPIGAQSPAVFRNPLADRDPAIDAQLSAILDSPLYSHETPAQGFARKERDLGNAFIELSCEAAGDMLQRLALNFATDTLARKFGKLAIERRERLLDFLEVLSDPMRRAGLMAAMG
jgi:hypothetical protein